MWYIDFNYCVIYQTLRVCRKLGNLDLEDKVV